MSKMTVALLGFCLFWLVAFGIAGYYMGEAGVEKLAHADYASTPATELTRGADVRVAGTIVEGPPAVAPYSQKACLAAVTDIAVVGFYRDPQDKYVRESHHAATRRVGPASIEIGVGDERIELPLERWTPKHYSVEEVDELPERLGVTSREIDIARSSLRGKFERYSVSESTIDSGTRVFVVGRLEDREGPLRLEADRVLERVEVYPGSQDDFVEELRGSAAGLRIAGGILGAGVGPLPLVIMGLILLLRRRKLAVPSAAPGE
jgi:hypothetical protein